MPVITTLAVPGMTCGHCVSAVTNELKEVTGVQRVSVELRKGDVSEVTILSHGALDEHALRAAIDEAGYEIQSIAIEVNGLAEQGQEQHDQREEFYGSNPA
jgi:copper chaperone